MIHCIGSFGWVILLCILGGPFRTILLALNAAATVAWLVSLANSSNWKARSVIGFRIWVDFFSSDLHVPIVYQAVRRVLACSLHELVLGLSTILLLLDEHHYLFLSIWVHVIKWILSSQSMLVVLYLYILVLVRGWEVHRLLSLRLKLLRACEDCLTSCTSSIASHLELRYAWPLWLKRLLNGVSLYVFLRVLSIDDSTQVLELAHGRRILCYFILLVELECATFLDASTVRIRAHTFLWGEVSQFLSRDSSLLVSRSGSLVTCLSLVVWINLRLIIRDIFLLSYVFGRWAIVKQVKLAHIGEHFSWELLFQTNELVRRLLVIFQ